MNNDCLDGRTDGQKGDEEGIKNINGATATKNDDVQTTEIGRLGRGEGEEELLVWLFIQGGPIRGSEARRMGVNSQRARWMCALHKWPLVGIGIGIGEEELI